MNVLTPEEARRELDLAAEKMPGPWMWHSISVAENAGLIAVKINGMDSERAHVMGLLHDIDVYKRQFQRYYMA